ncbi:toxin glutamine deamidase domain-containing protein [Nocardia sp. NPDC004750]
MSFSGRWDEVLRHLLRRADSLAPGLGTAASRPTREAGRAVERMTGDIVGADTELGHSIHRQTADAGAGSRDTGPRKPVSASGAVTDVSHMPPVGELVDAAHAGQMGPGEVAGKPIADGTRGFLRIFPELRGVNPGFATGAWGFRHNCASCAVAVDQRLAGKYVTAIKRPKSAENDWRWPDDLLKAVGTRSRFQPVSGFAEVEKTMLSAGPEARGIVYGIRRDADGKLVAAHTFNVINRRRRVFYVDGQHGGWANTDGYAELRLLRTN